MMTTSIIADTFNELYSRSVAELVARGEYVEPRGQPCIEILNPQLILTDPSKCLITIPSRKMNYAYAIIEKLQYLSMRSDVDTICWYNQNMRRFVNERTGQFDGAYGLRILDNDQLNWCFKKLREDPMTRQAVVTIHDQRDCIETLDPACTLSFQFLIRGGKLHMTCNMRSNDILWGTCLDIQAFCFIQQVMAFWLGIPMGNYIHQPASLHYYKDREEQVIAPMTEWENNQLVNNCELVPAWDVAQEDSQEALDAFWQEEKNLRNRVEPDWESIKSKALTSYLKRLQQYIFTKYEKEVLEGTVQTPTITT